MSTAQIALPDWDADEISRKLEENTRYLAEWTELLDKNGFKKFEIYTIRLLCCVVGQIVLNERKSNHPICSDM